MENCQLSSIFATVQEGAGEAGQGSEEELVARVRYIRSLRKLGCGDSPVEWSRRQLDSRVKERRNGLAACVREELRGCRWLFRERPRV